MPGSELPGCLWVHICSFALTLLTSQLNPFAEDGLHLCCPFTSCPIRDLVEGPLQLPRRKRLQATKSLQSGLGAVLDEHEQNRLQLRGWKTVTSRCFVNSSITQLPCILQHGLLLDARRTRDGARVSLKCIDVSRHPYEIEIGRYFCSSPLGEDPANHCVPIYDVLEVPDTENLMILVMPLLRNVTDPCFDTVGEVVDCIHQLFEVRSSFTDLHFL